MANDHRSDELASESSYALVYLPSQHNRGGLTREMPPFSRSNSHDESLQASSLPDEPSTVSSFASPQKGPGRIPFFRRLGKYLLFCNIGASILLLGALSALSFLWFEDNRNNLWTRVMIDGWVGQAVTLCTLAIRLAVATQASTAVAMLAAIQLETRQDGGVLLAKAPAISIARHVNTGPVNSLLVFWENISWSKCGAIPLLVALLALSTLISQFTSTLLLWDVRSGLVQGFPRQSLEAVGASMEGHIDGSGMTMEWNSGYWTTSPQNFPTFAEYSAEPRARISSIADTGPNIRAFLPINSQLDRSKISRFEGTAAVFDARVVCVRPMLTNETFIFQGIESGYAGRLSYFEGYAQPTELTDEIKEILRLDQTSIGLSFQCMLDNVWWLTDPTFKICSVGQVAGGLINSLDHMSNGSVDDYSYAERIFPDLSDLTYRTWMASNNHSNQTWPVEMGHISLILRFKSNSGLSNGVPHYNFSGSTMNDSGVWVDFMASASQSGDNGTAELSMTMCYDAWYDNGLSSRTKHLQEMPVSASRRFNGSEPSLAWDPKRQAFDTTAIRSQLGVRTEHETERAVLELDINKLRQFRHDRSESWSPDYHVPICSSMQCLLWYPNTADNLSFDLEDQSSRVRALNGNSTTNETFDFVNTMMWRTLVMISDVVDHSEISALCGYCSGIPTRPLHSYSTDVAHTNLNPILSAIFRDTILETNNPALAWQALTTTVARMIYYDWLPTFDSYANVTTTSMIPCQIPMHHTGFTIVVINLVVHLALFLSITIWFHKTTRASLLNNAWQVVAQLHCNETEQLLREATTSTDKEVKERINQGEEPRRRFRISRDARSGHMRLS